MKTVLSACLFLFVVLGFAFAEEPQTVHFWASLPESDNAQMQALVQRFNESHPSRPIEFRNFSTRNEFYQALQGNELPQIALVDSRWVSDLKDKIVPADDVLQSAGSMVRAVAEADTFKQIWNTCVLDKKVYAIPFSAETAALVVNPIHFDKTPHITTVQQWIKLGTKLNKGIVNVWGNTLPLHWDDDALAEFWLDFMGTNAKPPFNLHDEAATLNLWWNWINRLKITPVDPPELPKEFIHGATWVMLPRDVESLTQNFLVERLPRGKHPWGYLHVEALIFFDSKRSWDFANFLTDYPQLKFWSMSTATVPVDKQVYLSPDYLRDVDARRPWMRTFIDAIVTASPPIPLDSLEQRRLIGDLLRKGLKKELSVQSATLKIHDELNSHPHAMKPVQEGNVQ